MFCSNNSLMFGDADGWAASRGAPTSTRALAVAVPPAPLAVIVYVVDWVGVTGVEPSGATFPTPGPMSRSVAFVDDHSDVAVCPGVTARGEAFSVTVGCAAGGAGVRAGGDVATCFLHPPTNEARVTSAKSSPSLRNVPCCIDSLLRRPARA